jgi:hypothetical protein
MTNHAKREIAPSSPIEYLWDGEKLEPALVFDTTNSGRELALRGDNSAWAAATRDYLRREPGVIQLAELKGQS